MRVAAVVVRRPVRVVALAGNLLSIPLCVGLLVN